MWLPTLHGWELYVGGALGAHEFVNPRVKILGVFEDPRPMT